MNMFLELAENDTLKDLFIVHISMSEVDNFTLMNKSQSVHENSFTIYQSYHLENVHHLLARKGFTVLISESANISE